MTIEEKAKRYDEAIRRAKAMKKVAAAQDGAICFANTIFPELQESEDERIRWAIIDHLKDNNLTELAAWLEKQGEQKPQGKSALEAIKEERVDNQNKCFAGGECKAKREAEQNPTIWSGEDESILQGIWDEILANKHDAKEYEWKTYDKFLDWLKAIKQRIGG